MEWLFQSDFDTLTTIALWTIAAVLVTTVILFVYTMGLRVATISSNQRRRSFLNRWRDVFATSMLDPEAARQQSLPRVRRSDRIDLLEEWNRTRSMVDGSAVDNLIALAQRTGIPETSLQLIHSRRMQSKILAVQTIGHLQLTEMREQVLELLTHENTALSITAATALVDINPDFGSQVAGRV